MYKYTDDEILNKLFEIEKWTYENNKLRKRFFFNNFKEAFHFMTKVSDYAEAIKHHPEWCNIFQKVEVNLTTHDVNGITDLDFQLANKMNEIANTISCIEKKT